MTIEFSHFSHKVCGQTIEQLFLLYHKKEFKSLHFRCCSAYRPKKVTFHFIDLHRNMIQFHFTEHIFLAIKNKRQFLIKFRFELSYFEKMAKEQGMHVDIKLLFKKVSTFHAVSDTQLLAGTNFLYLSIFISTLISQPTLFFYISNCSLCIARYRLVYVCKDKYFCCALFAFFYQFDFNHNSVVFAPFLPFSFLLHGDVSSFKIYIRWNLFIHVFLFIWLGDFGVFFLSFISYCFAWAC